MEENYEKGCGQMHGLIFLTALLPTKGHQFLIDFAGQYMKKMQGDLHVILSCRFKEPIYGHDRIAAFQRQNTLKNVHFYLHSDDDAPQNPIGDNDIEFWDYWKNTAIDFVKNQIDYVFASETYGMNVAKSLNAKFIPCDIGREIVDSKSTNVRQNILVNFDKILPSIQKYFKQTVTIFGAESCGKTTTTRKLHEKYNSYMIPEWARGYLETVGPELSEEKMMDIVHGQYAIQRVVHDLFDKPYVFQDTDLLSTIGYFEIFGLEVPEKLIKLFNETKSNLYVVMNSNIPFEEDILRYGGHVRESTDQFWINLLEKYNCNYYVTKSSNFDERINEIDEQLSNLWNKFNHIKEFERE